MNFKEFIYELRESKVLRDLSIYAVSAWLVIQVAATTFPFLDFPTWTVTTIIIICVLGFPIHLVFTLYKSIKRKRIGEHYTYKFRWNSLFTKFLMLYLLMSVILVYSLSTYYNPESSQSKNSTLNLMDEIDPISSEKIAVLNFENLTGKSELDDISKMASYWITHGLKNNGAARTISYNSIQNNTEHMTVALGSTRPTEVFTKNTGATDVINGAYYLQNDTLIFQSMIINLITGETRYSFNPVRTPVSDPINGIEMLNQRIVGYWLTKDKKILKEKPPTFTAYKYYLAAKEQWDKDNDLVRNNINKAIQEDPEFLRPYFLKIALERNLANYSQADSIILFISDRIADFTNDQQALFRFFKADLEGKNLEAYEAYKIEYNMDPKDWLVNISMAGYALWYANKAEEAIAILKQLDDVVINYEICEYCAYIQRIKTGAYIKLGKYKEALKEIEALNQVPYDQDYFLLKIRAYARSFQRNDLKSFLQQFKGKRFTFGTESYLYYLAAKETYMVGDDELFNELAATFDELAIEDEVFTSAQIELMRENYAVALPKINQYLNKRPNSKNFLTKKAICLYKLGNQEEADSIKNRLEASKTKYDFGRTDYYLSEIALANNDEKESLRLLRISIADGRKFFRNSFEFDTDFKPLAKQEDFISLVSVQ